MPVSRRVRLNAPPPLADRTKKLSSKLSVALALLAVCSAASAYEFEVSNATNVRITGIAASEDGETWGAFDVKGGIPGRSKTTLVWSSETDNSDCEWLVKATYADGSESDPASFDFCEEDLEIVFSE